MSSNPNLTVSTLTVQTATNLTAGTVSALQAAQSLDATSVNEGGQFNLTYSTYTAGTDGFVLGTCYPPSGWQYGDSMAGWMQAYNSSGAYAFATGGVLVPASNTQASNLSSLILPICQNETFTIYQSYFTSTQPPLMVWWFIPSGTGSCTLASTQTPVLAAGTRLSDLPQAVRQAPGTSKSKK